MIVKIKEGDVLQLKKKHPCQCDLFDVLRVGSDLRLRCRGCGRDLTAAREKIEPKIKKVLPGEEPAHKV